MNTYKQIQFINKNQSLSLCSSISSLVKRRMQSTGVDEIYIMNRTGLTQKQVHFVLNESDRANLEHMLRVLSCLDYKLQIY